MYQLQDSNRVGRSLFATKSIAQGTLVLKDSQALIHFEADKLDRLAAYTSFQNRYANPLDFIAKYRSLPALALSAASVIDYTSFALLSSGAAAADQQQQNMMMASFWKHCKEMHCPQLPVSTDTLLLYQSCQELIEIKDAQLKENHQKQNQPTATKTTKSETIQEAIVRFWMQEDQQSSAATDTSTILATATSAVLHAVMALKTNAHRRTDGLWCLYPLASKLAHSCDPNCYFVPPSPDNVFTASFVALRPIAKGEVLSFSYLGGPPLLLSTHQRRLKLQRSHLFVCRCARCDETDDVGSAIVIATVSSTSTTTLCPNCKTHNNNNNTKSAQKQQQSTVQYFTRRSCPLGLPDADLAAIEKGSWKCSVCSKRLITDNDIKQYLRQRQQQQPHALETSTTTTTMRRNCSIDDDDWLLPEEDVLDPQIVFGGDNSSTPGTKKPALKHSVIACSIRNYFNSLNHKIATSDNNSNSNANGDDADKSSSTTTSPMTNNIIIPDALFLSNPLIAECCRQATLYFTLMCQISVKATMTGLTPKTKPKVTPFQLLFCWTLKYFSCLEQLGMMKMMMVGGGQHRDRNVCDPPHMLVVERAISLIDLCLTEPPKPPSATTKNNKDNDDASSSSSNNNQGSSKGASSSGEIMLVPDATPATGILAVLAQHCRPLVESISKVQRTGGGGCVTSSSSSTTTSTTKKSTVDILAKFDVLCELDWEYETVKNQSLMSVLEMACADDLWKCMAYCQKPTKENLGGFKRLLDAWDS